MTIEVNGDPRDVADTITVGRLVDAEAGTRDGVAVAVDGEVVPRAVWDRTPVAAGARVEIVAAAQGG